MRLIIRLHPVRLFESALWLAGIALLGYVGLIQFEAWSFNRVLDTPTTNLPVKAPRDSMGRLEIPRLAISAKILEGTSDATLDKAVGHLTNTPIPGEPGNIALAAHRDTIFRPLRNIQVNDEITITDQDNIYRYRVDSTTIVLPTDLSVLKPRGHDTLTLITCYPFYYIGSAPRRFIVHARLLPQPTRSLL